MTRTRWLSFCAIAIAVSAAAAEPITAQKHEIPLANAYVRGPKDASVTIVEFSDFQCPYCVQATALVDQVLKAYPRNVNFVYKNFPLPMHPNADPAARAALAAGKQGKFWEMHDELFKHAGDLSPQTIRSLAEKLRLDVAKFDADMTSPAVKAQVDLEVRQGKVAGVRGTPSFFINGRMTQNRSLEGFRAIIEEELKNKSG